ncbi:ester cyclase [Patescibacteria group bacterium]|nr:ester cyclase [Patescibacteria group bacterium]
MPKYTSLELRNIDLVKEGYYGKVFDRGDQEYANKLFHPEFINKTHPNWGEVCGPEAIMDVVTMLRSGLSKFHTKIDRIVAVDNEVWVWATQTGIHNKGYIMGQAPTGKVWSSRQSHIILFNEEGQVIEHDAIRNDLITVNRDGTAAD